MRSFTSIMSSTGRPGPAAGAARDPVRAALNFARDLNPADVARQLAAVLASGDRSGALASVRVPTLVIHGDDG